MSTSQRAQTPYDSPAAPPGAPSAPAQTVAAVLAWGAAILSHGCVMAFAVGLIWFTRAFYSTWDLWPALVPLGALAASAALCAAAGRSPRVRGLSVAGRRAVLGTCAAALPVAGVAGWAIWFHVAVNQL